MSKQSFRNRVKQLFAQVFNVTTPVTNYLIKKQFPSFKSTCSVAWADVCDALVLMTEATMEETTTPELPEITLPENPINPVLVVANKYDLSVTKRNDNTYSVYKNDSFLGEVYHNLSGMWFYSFRSNGTGRRASSLEGATIQLINNHLSNSNFKAQSKEYYDLFTA
jgi:hypothetical protein